MVTKAELLVFVCFFWTACVRAETAKSASVTWDATNNKFNIQNGISGDWVASAKFINAINSTGLVSLCVRQGQGT